MKLRTEIGILFLAISSLSLSGTAFFLLRENVRDKQKHSQELGSFLAPSVSDSIERRLDALVTQAPILFQVLQKKSIDPALFSSPEWNGILKVILRAPRHPPFTIDFRGSNSDIDDQQIPIANPGELTEFALKKGASLVVVNIPVEGHGNAFFLLEREFFKPSFELARGAAVSLLTPSGSTLFPTGEKPITLVKVPLQELSSASIVSHENINQDGNKEWQTFRGFQKWRGAWIVVTLKSVGISELVPQALHESIYFLLFMLMLSILFALFLARHIAQPIEELTDATARVAKGEKEITLRVKSRNEVGKLIRSFNKMMKALTERESELKQAQQKLVHSESLAAVGRLGAGVAHEVKNPLSAILGYAQLLDRYIEKREIESRANTFQEYLRFIMEETRRASRIIGDLLTFSRQKTPVIQAVDFLSFLKNIESRIRPQFEESGIRFELQSSISSAMNLSFDAEQIYQVIFNLIQNAKQALEGMPPSATSTFKQVILVVESKGQEILMKVIDNGPGISEENLTKIFQPFFSTKDAGKGTGLGLAICHGIVAQHSGRIEVASTIDKGTSFLLALPKN